MANVLQPHGYLIEFNSPRITEHTIDRRKFIPFNKFFAPLEGLYLSAPAHRAVDVVHAFNRVPVTNKPLIVSFESHMPRAFGAEDGRVFRFLTQRLLAPNCRKIIAISNWASNMFRAQHGERTPEFEELFNKLEVIYPSTYVQEDYQLDITPDTPIRIAFIGAHFARKGGLVGLRAAKMCHDRGWPVTFEFVSGMTMGASVWSDPARAEWFEKDLALQELPNVVMHGRLPNAKVVKLLRESHFSMLATVSDTFGFSAIESLAVGTPVIASDICALSEVIEDGVNGMMLELPVNERNVWVHLPTPDKSAPEFERHFDEAVESMARQLVAKLESYVNDRTALSALRDGAHTSAATRFNTELSSPLYNAMYDEFAQAGSHRRQGASAQVPAALKE